MSQPSWAEWIEMLSHPVEQCVERSQPSWAAWIEIACDFAVSLEGFVAALLGCVD